MADTGRSYTVCISESSGGRQPSYVNEGLGGHRQIGFLTPAAMSYGNVVRDPTGSRLSVMPAIVVAQLGNQAPESLVRDFSNAPPSSSLRIHMEAW